MNITHLLYDDDISILNDHRIVQLYLDDTTKALGHCRVNADDRKNIFIYDIEFTYHPKIDLISTGIVTMRSGGKKVLNGIICKQEMKG